MEKERMITAAREYLARGWKLFTVGANKRPWMNCPACPAGAHDGEQCPHPFCHGFHAATDDMSVILQMLDRQGASLALRTGGISGVAVVDAEGTDRVGAGSTGVDALEDWSWWGEPLKARTSGGGLHLFYAVGEDAIPSRNRVVPNIDIKADGGYVVLPPAEGRWWVNWTPLGGTPPAPQEELREWLHSAKGKTVRRIGVSSGVSRGRKTPFEGETVPAGVRYEFTRDLIYRLRKQGLSREELEDVALGWWRCYEQPPIAQFELPERQVLYEIERVWVRVDPEPDLSEALTRWIQTQKKGEEDGQDGVIQREG